MAIRVNQETGDLYDDTGLVGPSLLPGDLNDTAKLAPFQPAIGAAAGEQWWESLIKYGAVRAIDNRFGPTNIAGNNAPGSFAGTNGSTYFQAPNALGTTLLGGGGMIAGVPSWIVLAGLAAVAAYLIARG